MSSVITALAVYIYLSGIHKPVVIQRIPVVVASVQIKEGQEIKLEMVSVKMMPAEAVVNNAATKLDDVVGRISSTTVEQGEQMLVSRFFKAGDSDNTLAYALEKGKRAFTIAVNPVSGIAGLIKPRDTVDVLMIVGVIDDKLTPQDAQPITTTYSRILLQNIMVLATGQVILPSEAKADNTVETITLSVTPEQAVQLNLAVAEGKISLALRSPIDTATPDIKDMDVQDIVGNDK
jgi:pilus assembly protein CpaB